jgi:hypothetical protein
MRLIKAFLWGFGWHGLFCFLGLAIATAGLTHASGFANLTALMLNTNVLALTSLVVLAVSSAAAYSAETRFRVFLLGAAVTAVLVAGLGLFVSFAIPYIAWSTVFSEGRNILTNKPTGITKDGAMIVLGGASILSFSRALRVKVADFVWLWPAGILAFVTSLPINATMLFLVVTLLSIMPPEPEAERWDDIKAPSFTQCTQKGQCEDDFGSFIQLPPPPK